MRASPCQVSGWPPLSSSVSLPWALVRDANSQPALTRELCVGLAQGHAENISPCCVTEDTQLSAKGAASLPPCHSRAAGHGLSSSDDSEVSSSKRTHVSPSGLKKAGGTEKPAALFPSPEAQGTAMPQHTTPLSTRLQAANSPVCPPIHQQVLFHSFEMGHKLMWAKPVSQNLSTSYMGGLGAL